MMTRLAFAFRNRYFLRSSPLIALALLAALGGCNNNPRNAQQEDAEIQRRSAEAAAKIKAGTAKAEVVAKEATANAARRLNDVAAGVKQGIQNGPPPSKPSAGRLDLNSATSSELATLPGISSATADAIVDGRPYTSTRQLVKKGIVTPAEYQRIAGRLTAR